MGDRLKDIIAYDGKKPTDDRIGDKWSMKDDGIWLSTYDRRGRRYEERVLYHPLNLLARLKNEETGEEKVILEVQKDGISSRVSVPRIILSSKSKIVDLSRIGIMITTGNAAKVVEYILDYEDHFSLPLIPSTGKFGWHGTAFCPYDKEIYYDAEDNFSGLYDALRPAGYYKRWMDHVKQLRQTDRLEIKVMLAASFASVLLHKLSVLPFIIDLYGMTEGGKSVSLKVAASIWGDPRESRYIGDFQATPSALEAKDSALNHLTLFFFFSSKTLDFGDSFENLVYNFASGKGKSRSNLSLGNAVEQTWQNITLTTGERALQSFIKQGGGLNRVLEVRMQGPLYADPRHTCDVVDHNFGHAGPDFIKILQSMDDRLLRKLYQEILAQVQTADKMQKQTMSVSAILLADYLTEKYLFRDGIRIKIPEALSMMLDKSEVSDFERAYHHLQETFILNYSKFADKEDPKDKWGFIEEDYMVIIDAQFTKLCQQGGFSKKSFLQWADKKGLLICDKGRLNKTKTVKTRSGKSCSVRCVYLKIK